jgi:hypothetical protein
VNGASKLYARLGAKRLRDMAQDKMVRGFAMRSRVYRTISAPDGTHSLLWTISPSGCIAMLAWQGERL